MRRWKILLMEVEEVKLKRLMTVLLLNSYHQMCCDFPILFLFPTQIKCECRKGILLGSGMDDYLITFETSSLVAN